MQLIDKGRGAPLVFIPGLQGRWEYAQITVDALAEHFRVITFSLCDEPTADAPFDGARGFDTYGDHVAAALDAAGVDRAIVCGLSFGGLVALNFASRFLDRVDALVLASTPGPGFRLRRRHEVYARLPWIFGPIFAIETPFRVGPELRLALRTGRERRAFGSAMLKTALRAPISLPRMGARARLIASYDIPGACARITAPTLVVTGEPRLDFVVDVAGTSEYTRQIRGARHIVLEGTGHQGTLTRRTAFVDIVRRFVDGIRDAAA